MIIKQYAVALPSDYDMATIRKRVAKKGPAYDDFPGLGLKIFMIREKGKQGAESNQYAPVYLWPAVEPMWEFIAGEGFAGILDSFGWTPIKYWLGLAYARRENVALTTIRSVSRAERPVMPGSDLSALRKHEIKQAREAVTANPDLLVRALGMDVDRWSLAQFDYWRCEQQALPEGSWSYEALHVSAPDPSALKQT